MVVGNYYQMMMWIKIVFLPMIFVSEIDHYTVIKEMMEEEIIKVQQEDVIGGGGGRDFNYNEEGVYLHKLLYFYYEDCKVDECELLDVTVDVGEERIDDFVVPVEDDEKVDVEYFELDFDVMDK
ncbi:MAG: hypothetical protein EZS28_003307 [Streblomastix strix]|uniref:Uncharacterized protein n=1 Tax=Streblomastix strix TaxID=222440 RepID=A0A5J4X335_9EUKA|nr:MAG: hypothetical protein EZS28_003307 [Streblomastix strix]